MAIPACSLISQHAPYSAITTRRNIPMTITTEDKITMCEVKKMTALPNIDRELLLSTLQRIKKQNAPGNRGKCLELYCKGHVEACNEILGEIMIGGLEAKL